ncbi:MAG: class I SAM-dependent methyltransferase [Rhodothermales bacterium]
MNDVDVQAVVDRRLEGLERYGRSAAALGDGKGGRQDVRFAVYAEYILDHDDASVLDLGCGFADLFEYLRRRGWRGRYRGVEIVPEYVEQIRRIHPELEVLQGDVETMLEDLPTHDFVVAASIMNLRLKAGENEAYIRRMMRRMFDRADVAAGMDFMTTYVDWQHPDAWHTDPAWAVTEASRLTRRVVLRADFMPYEFVLILFKDDRASVRNVYRAFEARLDASEVGGGDDA